MTVTTRWWWIRHAPVDNPERRLYGQNDLDAICTDGTALRRLAAILPDDAVWLASHLKRTHQTAEALRAHVSASGRAAPEIIPLPDLAEQHFGAWQGMSLAELRAHLGEEFQKLWTAPGSAEPPDGESFADVIERVRACIADVNRHHGGRDIVALAHGGSIRAALAVALDVGPDAALSFQIRNLSLTRIDHVVPGEEPGFGSVRPWLVHEVNLVHEED